MRKRSCNQNSLNPEQAYLIEEEKERMDELGSEIISRLQSVKPKYALIFGEFLKGVDKLAAIARMLYGYAQEKLAYLLSQHDDLASKEQAKAIYAELVQIGHEVELCSNNLRITRARIAMIHLKRAETGDREAAQIAYSLYSEMAKDYPDHKYAGNAAYVKNQFLQ